MYLFKKILYFNFISSMISVYLLAFEMYISIFLVIGCLVAEMSMRIHLKRSFARSAGFLLRSVYGAV